MMQILPKVLISSEALTVIEEESRNGTTETGGVLFGVTGQEGTIVITHATKPGQNAFHAPGTFANDLQYQQNLLNIMNKRYNVDYVGEWHKHLGQMNYPSPGDSGTARTILKDPEWNKEKLIVIIANTIQGQVLISPFFISRNTPNFRPIKSEKIPLKVIHPEEGSPHRARKIQANGEKVETEKTEVEVEGIKQWFDTKDGKSRLVKEKESLENIGLSYKIILRKDKELCFIITAKNTLQFDKILITLPRDYPASPPDIVIQRGEKLMPFKGSKQISWTPEFTISDLIFDLTNSDTSDYQDLVNRLRSAEQEREKDTLIEVDERPSWLKSSDGKKRIKRDRKSLRKLGLKRIHIIPIINGMTFKISNIVKDDKKINLIFECLENEFPDKIPNITIEHENQKVPVSLLSDFAWDESKDIGEIAKYIMHNLSRFLERRT